MKKIIFTFLFFLAISPIFAIDFTVDGINYSTTSDSTVQVVRGNYTDSVIIPSVVTFSSANYLVKYIGESAFSSCSGLTSVTIPRSVISILSNSFEYDNSLTSINVDSTNQNYTSFNGVLFNKKMSNLIQYPPGLSGNYMIPNSVDTIGDYAFYACGGLTSVTFGNSVLYIGKSSFSACNAIKSITIPNSVTFINAIAFFNCTSLMSVTIPSSVISIGTSAFNVCPSLTSINVDSANLYYSSIDGVLFNKKGNKLIQFPAGILGNYSVPSSVDSIGNAAFVNCTGLTSITIPSSVISIGNVAFVNCTGLTSFIIPNSVTFIGKSAFSNCSNLTSITIPSSVTFIGNYPFNSDTGLTSINVDPDNKYYTSLDGVLFDKNLKILIQFPDAKSGDYIIPNSVDSIYDWAFAQNSNLNSVVIGDSVKSIGKNAFDECSSLKSVNIPNSVSYIGEYAFFYCNNLNSVTIGDSVKYIGDDVFAWCFGLDRIYTYAKTPIDLSSSLGVFDEVNKTYCTLYVPKGSLSLYQSADQWKDFSNIVEFDATSAVNNPEGNKINITFNPVTHSISVKGVNKPANVMIYDMSGKLRFSGLVESGNPLLVNDLPRGIYVVKAVVENQYFVQKMLLN